MTIYRRPDPVPLPTPLNESSTALRPLRAERDDLNSLAARRIFLAIVSQLWGAAGMLPKEDDLGRELGVSRTVLREAIKTLSSKSVVETKRRWGTTILDRSHWNLLDSQLIAWLIGTQFVPDLGAALLEVLKVVQPEAARLVAGDEPTRLTTAVRLRAVALGDAATRFGAFNRALCEPLDNPFLLSVVTKSIVALQDLTSRSFPEDLKSIEDGLYLKICDSIAAGDRENAADGVRSLLAIEPIATKAAKAEQDSTTITA